MKLLSFETDAGTSYGRLEDHGVIDLGQRLGTKYPDLRTLLEESGQAEAEAIASVDVDYRLDEISYLQVRI